MSLLGTDYGIKDKKNQDQIWGRLAAQTNALYSGAYADKISGLRAVQGSYASAGRMVSGRAALATGRVASDAAGYAASDKQSAVDRGLGDSSASIDRAAAADTGRAQAHIDTGINALQASLAMKGGGAVADQYNQIAGLKSTFGSQVAQMDADRIAAYNAIKYGRQGGLLKPILTAVGGIVGAYYGGPAGASAGAAAGGAVGGGAEGEY